MQKFTEVHDVFENFNMEVQTTASESPQSIGFVERRNQTLTYTMNKIRAEKQCDWEKHYNWQLWEQLLTVLFQDTVHIRQCLDAIQICLLFLQTEGTTMSHFIENHLNTLHAPRKAFMEAESS